MVLRPAANEVRGSFDYLIGLGSGGNKRREQYACFQGRKEGIFPNKAHVLSSLVQTTTLM